MSDITRMPARRDVRPPEAQARSPAVVNFLNNYDAVQRENEDLRREVEDLRRHLRGQGDELELSRKKHETEAEFLRMELARVTQESNRYHEGFIEMKAHVEGLQIQATQALVVSRRKMEAAGLLPPATGTGAPARDEEESSG